jgi:hypothetical protein
MPRNGKNSEICNIQIKSCVVHAKSHVSLHSQLLCHQHLSQNDLCHTLWLNSGNPGTLLTVLYSPKPTKKAVNWDEFPAVESDYDNNDFLHDKSSVYHFNSSDESDDSLSNSSYPKEVPLENLEPVLDFQRHVAKKESRGLYHIKKLHLETGKN